LEFQFDFFSSKHSAWHCSPVVVDPACEHGASPLRQRTLLPPARRQTCSYRFATSPVFIRTCGTVGQYHPIHALHADVIFIPALRMRSSCYRARIHLLLSSSHAAVLGFFVPYLLLDVILFPTPPCQLISPTSLMHLSHHKTTHQIQRPPNQMILHPRTILRPPTPDHNHRMLLHIMPLTRNIRRDNFPRTQTHTRDFALA